jgi:UDPglucose 6-dehydrogenase
LGFLGAVDEINERCRDRAVDLCRQALGGQLVDRRVAILGAAFKPDSDDIRDSPALEVAMRLLAAGASVTVCDPAALANAAKKYPRLSFAGTPLEAGDGAEACLLATEWAEYVSLDPAALGAVVANRRMIDCRNVLDEGKWGAAGWTVQFLGRTAPVPSQAFLQTLSADHF